MPTCLVACNWLRYPIGWIGDKTNRALVALICIAPWFCLQILQAIHGNSVMPGCLFGWVLFLFSWTPRILFATWQRAGCSRVRQFVRGYVRIYAVQQAIWVSVGGCGCCFCCCRRLVALIHIMFPFLVSHLYRPRRTSPQVWQGLAMLAAVYTSSLPWLFTGICIFTWYLGREEPLERTWN